MTTPAFRFGYRIVGPCSGARRLIDWAAALAAYAACDPRAECEREAYLSAFAFADDFCDYLTATGSTKGFSGACWAPFIWFDLDRDHLDQAAADARRLAAYLDDRYALPEGALLSFFSGAKGFHIGLPTAPWRPAPSLSFHRVARRFAEGLAERAKIKIDSGVYDRVRAFRAPNSRHPKTGLHKRALSLDELLGLSTTAIVARAAEPTPFELPVVSERCDLAAADWAEAERAVERAAQAHVERRAGSLDAHLNRATLAFIRDGAPQGDRHRLLYSAAANLAEFGCSSALAHALLTEAALDSGLSPSDVRRQIECGLAAIAGGPQP